MKVSETVGCGKSGEWRKKRSLCNTLPCRGAFDSISEFIKKVLGKVVVRNDFTYSPQDCIIE